MPSNDSTEISRPCWLRICTKRDMCVPLKLCGRCTYMLNVAMVCCTPTLLSLTTTGWRMLLMPTLLIASWRVSTLLCTSAICVTEFILNSLVWCLANYTHYPSVLVRQYRLCSFSDRAGYAGRIQAAIGQHLHRIALLQEHVGQPQVQQGDLDAMLRQALSHRAARPPLYRLLYHGAQ